MMAAQRRYIPANVPLVKRVVAVAGDEVCALGQEIFVNGKLVVHRRIADAKGRPMKWWTGCVRLPGRQLFLFMSDSPAALDWPHLGCTDGGPVFSKPRTPWAHCPGTGRPSLCWPPPPTVAAVAARVAADSLPPHRKKHRR